MNAQQHPGRRSMPALAARLAGVAVVGSLLVGFAAWAGHRPQSTPITVGELRQHVACLADRRNDPQLLARFETRVRGAAADDSVIELFRNRPQIDLAARP